MKTVSQSIYVGKSQYFDAQGCLAISFFRPSNTNNVRIDGVPVAAGTSFNINQNVGDADFSSYNIVFESGALANELYITQIFPLNNG